ncbi:hypothetical protein MRS44_015222 [Fusarium solani]|uniref:uncharacterized protein n=1 Tax=Fusarium solani TaxID=169388 RepID=UPI0032C43FD2|nr:hypothetical protein MRS44_015222 [Fusarium solani]
MQISLENSMAAVDQSHRADRQTGSRISFEESSPERLATTRGIQTVHDTSDESPGSLDPTAHENISEDNVVLVRLSATSTEFGEGLSDQEVQAIDMQIERDLSSESPESAQDLWLDMGSMQRKVLRLASQALRSQQESKKEDESSNPQQRSGPDFEMPILFVCPPKNTHAPVLEREVIYLNGTDESRAATGSNLRTKRSLEDQLYTQGVGTANDEGATWVNLLNELQRMEHDSMAWEEEEYRKGVECTGEPNPDGVPASWLEHTMAVALQKQRRSWDTMPSNVKKPYAMTTISHLIEMAAMLGLYWKVFDRAEDKYRAEGNGCMLTGTAVPDLGLVFNFQVTGNRKFRETRLISTGDVRNLCFGVVLTIYWNLKNTERAGYPSDEPLGLGVLQVGSRREIAETLGRIGCNIVTCNFFLDDTKNVIHFFPGRLYSIALTGQDQPMINSVTVVFEILGMLSCTFHILNTMFTYVPNPISFRWEKNSVDLQLLLEAYLSHLTADLQWQIRNPARVELKTHGQRILDHNRESYLVGKIPLLKALHEAINDCDQILTAEDDTAIPQITQARLERRDVVQDILRSHIQEVSRLLNRDNDRSPDTDPDRNTNVLPATYRRQESVGDIHEAGPEERQDKFMPFYFSNIRPNVSARASRATDRRSAASATHARDILPHVGFDRAKRWADGSRPPSPGCLPLTQAMEPESKFPWQKPSLVSQ